MSDPFALLGVPRSADVAQIRRAWRLRMKRAHPDAGGTAAEVDALNRALREALAAAESSRAERHPRGRRERDVPSFTISALPAEAHEALLLVAGSAGPAGWDVVDSDPPYLLELLLRAEGTGPDAWCRCELMPEAGATTVFVSVEGASTDTVRDLLVAGVNELDWRAVSGE